MLKSEVQQKYKAIEDFVFQNKIIDAMEMLSGLLKLSGEGTLIDTLEFQRQNYSNVLKYSFTGMVDPQRDSIIEKIKTELLSLADLVKESIISKNSTYPFYKQRLELLIPAKREALVNSIELFIMDKDIAGFIQQKKDNDTQPGKEEIISRIFAYFWMTDKFRDEDLLLANNIFQSSAFEWFDRAVFVSALTLGLQRCFDKRKLSLLFDVYDIKENAIWQRALVALFLVFLQYRKRIDCYPEIASRLKLLKDDDAFVLSMEVIIIQFLRTRDTEKISKKLQEEILPEVHKYTPKLTEKLDLDNLFGEDMHEDKNPEWKTFFQDSPDLYDKLEEISKMHMDGSDVFLSAFSFLKHFDFFKKIEHWFLPFYAGNSYAREALSSLISGEESVEFIKNLSITPLMCNSDKFSFCFNVKMIPENQKNMIIELFKMELSGMKEMVQDDELLDKKAKLKYIVSQFLHDLYRFHHLYPDRGEFYNPFANNIINDNEVLVKEVITQEECRNIGEFYFENADYKEALLVFLNLYEESKNHELIEKIAYSYQKLKQWKEAISWYEKALLAEENSNWLMKNLAWSYRKSGNLSAAVEVYSKLEIENERDTHVVTNIAHCYLDNKQYDKAVNYYLKADFLSDSKLTFDRPVAWCFFMLKKYDESVKYYKKLIDAGKALNYDYINLAHVNFCVKDYKQAIGFYQKALTLMNHDTYAFELLIKADRNILQQHDVPDEELCLLIDYLKIIK